MSETVPYKLRKNSIPTALAEYGSQKTSLGFSGLPQKKGVVLVRYHFSASKQISRELLPSEKRARALAQGDLRAQEVVGRDFANGLAGSVLPVFFVLRKTEGLHSKALAAFLESLLTNSAVASASPRLKGALLGTIATCAPQLVARACLALLNSRTDASCVAEALLDVRFAQR